MNVKIYVGNLSKSTTRDELYTLFTQAGEVIAVDVIKDHRTGESRGFAFVTMKAQSEADQAVVMFNAYTLNDQVMKVSAAKPIL
jgi:RNA recognition motif-containing protein